ncbi:MAG: SO2930 family diheme c-type cytochrome [Bryobacteraceae bacterium]
MRVLALIAASLVLSGCGVRVVLDEPYPKRLSEWRLFTGELAGLKPAKGVLPYDINTPLFSDYASKERVVWMPAGKSATYNESEAFDFPQGAVLAKTFTYSGRHIETRILVNTRHGWVGLPYVWNQDQTEATLEVAPDPVTIHWTHPSGQPMVINYIIPNQNQCKGCHERSKSMTPIGPKARHLNKDYPYPEGSENQLVRWTRAGYLAGAPSPAVAPRNAVWDNPATGTLDARARAYMDANCGHCHNPQGPADTTGLYLIANQADPLRLGFCKVPVAAGHGAGDLRFDLVHGDPAASILIRRLNSVEPKVMMPELGRSTIHREGLALLTEWVAAARGDCSN